MKSVAITTVIKMMESLPENAQDQLVEHLRNYLEDMSDEIRWGGLFKKTEPKLLSAARQARKEIAKGLAKPMNHRDL